MADEPNEGPAPAPAGSGGAGEAGGAAGGGAVATRRRESALEKLKRQLAEHAADMPPLEGYDLRKAMKILRTAGFPLDKVRVRFIESEEVRGLVVRQYPDAGEKIDMTNDLYQMELCVSDSSAIDFLPSIYQRSDITGRNFLKDFLWIFQHIFNQTREKLDNIHTYFDPLETPADFLPWLGSWVAMVLDEDWPELKKRNLIRKAVELYHLRGTLRGIRIYLKIFTGVEPTIHENYWPFEGIQICPFPMTPVVKDKNGKVIDEDAADFEMKKIQFEEDMKKARTPTTFEEQKRLLAHPEWKGSTIMDAPEMTDPMIELPYVDKAHVFTIDLPIQQDQIELDMIKKIHRILEREKPAHTDYWVRFKEPEEKEEDLGITIGLRSTVGVDTFATGGD